MIFSNTQYEMTDDTKILDYKVRARYFIPDADVMCLKCGHDFKIDEIVQHFKDCEGPRVLT